MAARKRNCKHGVNKNTGACLKRPRRKKSRKASGSRKGPCKTVKLPGRTQKMCKRGKRWRFVKN